ncbi:aldose epimerase family protein [Carnobacterium mobile]|uniref:aldose epimerase family protein n=1 Tax=Carnobacterium mobile TaxID=2750 RepID=UPI001867B108|nr:aldose epimerase family protein [Carnobacterium mobile]
MKISKKSFGTIEGKQIIEYTLENSQGVQLSAMNYGATLTALRIPDKDGKIENVVLGFDSVSGYEKHSSFFGATVGRVAGRIKNGRFVLNGKKYQLSVNEGDNQLHGGGDFNSRIWNVKEEVKDTEASLIFTLLIESGSFGYPGNLNVQVSFILTENNEWKIRYKATTDETTLFNPTNHVYFNLTGNENETILNHQLTLISSKIVELNDQYIPTGKLVSVEGTAFDFRHGNKLKQGINSQHPQNQLVHGYDHAFVLDHKAGTPEAVLSDPVSGRRLKMYTDMDSVVLYSGNRLNEEEELVGYPIRNYSGLTLETQQLPDAINNEGFGSIILDVGQVFNSETIYQFDTI